MSTRLLIRKNSGDPDFPWTLIDTTCPTGQQHDFSGHEFANCNGNCDAFGTFEAALFFAGLVQS